MTKADTKTTTPAPLDPAVLPELAQLQQRLLEAMSGVRPELHRYCARMTGSVFDGEDVVQDTLAKALYALGQMKEPPEQLRPWLFRIAHNTALDFLKRYERKHVDFVDELPEVAMTDAELEADPREVTDAFAVLATLPPIQRSAVILKDVLGHSLQEAADTMGTTVLAVKGALVRARSNLAAAVAEQAPVQRPAAPDPRLQRYVALFNDRNWDGLRNLLADECQLDVVSRVKRRGKGAEQVGNYYTRYAAVPDIRCVCGTVEGREAIGVFTQPDSEQPDYFIFVEWDGDQIRAIRDYRHVYYIAQDAHFEASPLPGSTS
jgi:RNA polymerase sigma factor (sigma-70 family)